MPRIDSLEPIRREYRAFAETECRGYSDLYHRLALEAAEDDAIMAFVAARPVTQPNLLFAAVHYLTGPGAIPRTAPELRAFLETREGEVAEIMRTRRTQTNEVGRCATILPALPPGPLALVEVGASAGLCLLLDRYSYDYGSKRIGATSSPVRLRCEVTGEAPLPETLPEIVWRRGLDLSPVDVRDDDEVRWLAACVWPDHPERRARLDAAIALARSDPPPVLAGDLVDDLSPLIAEAPHDTSLVVFHSAVLAYLDRDRRDAFGDLLARASTDREITWISNESSGVVPRHDGAAPARAGLTFRLGRTTFRQGRGIDEPLALTQPHGLAMTWR